MTSIYFVHNTNISVHSTSIYIVFIFSLYVRKLMLFVMIIGAAFTFKKNSLRGKSFDHLLFCETFVKIKSIPQGDLISGQVRGKRCQTTKAHLRHSKNRGESSSVYSYLPILSRSPQWLWRCSRKSRADRRVHTIYEEEAQELVTASHIYILFEGKGR